MSNFASTVVSIEDVRRGVHRLLDQVQRRFGPHGGPAADYYWVIDPAATYDAVPPSPEHLTVGQLSDDVASLRQFLDRADEEPVAVWHDLARVTGILARIAALDRP